MASYKSKAISLKTAPFMEADKLVTLFSREHGKIRAIAKGARRVPSRLGGRVEPFTFADCFIAKGRNLDIVSQCEVIETFQKVRENAETLLAGLYILRLVDSGSLEGQVHPELFDLLLKSLYKLKDGASPGRVSKDFETEFAMLEGIFEQGMNARDVLSDHVGRDLKLW